MLVRKTGIQYATADLSYICEDGVAVFYPKGYDSSQHEPSPIFIGELSSTGDVPDWWNLRPQFSESDGKTIVRIPVGAGVDYYGNGEVSGSLRRNGKQVKFWNSDAPKYEVDGGRRLYQSHPWIMGVRPDGTSFGIIADNTWKSSVTMNEDIVFKSEGPAFRVVVFGKATPGVGR